MTTDKGEGMGKLTEKEITEGVREDGTVEGCVIETFYNPLEYVVHTAGEDGYTRIVSDGPGYHNETRIANKDVLRLAHQIRPEGDVVGEQAWTEDEPTEEGWYWYRQEPGDDPRPVKLEWYGSELWDEDGTYCVDEVGGEWRPIRCTPPDSENNDTQAKDTP